MGLAGWAPSPEGGEPFTDWVIMRMTVAALALPDVTMCRGTYPVPVARPYISGQEGVGVVVDAAPRRRDLDRPPRRRGDDATVREPRAGLGGDLHHLRSARRHDRRRRGAAS